MLHTFVALVSDKPGVLTRVASLFRRLNINVVSLNFVFALAVLSIVHANAQSAQLRIRILNGHTGKPITNVGIFPFPRTGLEQAQGVGQMPVTNIEGAAIINIAGIARINAIVMHYPTCRKVSEANRHNGPLTFSVDQIVSTGVVETNNCSKRTVPPTPGELTLFVRPLHIWERLSE